MINYTTKSYLDGPKGIYLEITEFSVKNSMVLGLITQTKHNIQLKKEVNWEKKKKKPSEIDFESVKRLTDVFLVEIAFPYDKFVR